MNNTYWYRVTLKTQANTSANSTKIQVIITRELVYTYIKNLQEYNSKLSEPLIIDIDSSNQKANGYFDTSVKAELFINTVSANLPLLKTLLTEASIQYISINSISHDRILQYRNTRDSAPTEVWSYIQLDPLYVKGDKLSAKFLLELKNIPNNINISAQKYNVSILEIFCPIMPNPQEIHNPIIIYIKHYSKDNDKIRQFVSTYKNICSIVPSAFHSVIGKLSNIQVENIKNKVQEQQTQNQFNVGDKVKVISGPMANLNLRGVIKSIVTENENSILVTCIILNNKMDFVFDVSDVELMPS